MGTGADLLVEGLPQSLQGQDPQRVLGHGAEALGALLAGKAAAVVQGLVAERGQVVAALHDSIKIISKDFTVPFLLSLLKPE